MTRDELAILRSVVYASLFDYPLRLEEVHRTLVECDAAAADVLATFSRSAALREAIEYRDGFFFPAGRADLVAERGRREARSRAFLERYRFVLRAICALPFMRMAALSGSIAHLNLEPDGDLDLFIVTRGHHVWTVTLAIVLLTKALGIRRAICTNFIVSDAQLAFDQRDLFTANQIIHLKPLVGASLMPELIAANPWVAHFYPNAVDALTTPRRVPDAPRCGTAGIVERACRALYGWHLRRKAAGWRSPDQVRLAADCLKLHTRSHRRSITGRFDAAVARAIALAERADEAVAVAAGSRRGARR